MFFTAKKIGAVSMTAAALLAASWGAQADGTDNSPSATVHITATVVGATCTPTWTAGDKVEVALGLVSDTDLAGVGDVGTTKPFSLSLKDCDDGVTKVAVVAMGTADSADSKAFANTAGDGAADGVAVTLFGGDDQKTQLAPGGDAIEYAVKDGAVDMTFLAKLERSAAVPDKGTKDGAVESTASLYMTYE